MLLYYLHASLVDILIGCLLASVQAEREVIPSMEKGLGTEPSNVLLYIEWWKFTPSSALLRSVTKCQLLLRGTLVYM